MLFSYLKTIAYKFHRFVTICRCATMSWQRTVVRLAVRRDSAAGMVSENTWLNSMVSPQLKRRSRLTSLPTRVCNIYVQDISSFANLSFTSTWDCHLPYFFCMSHFFSSMSEICYGCFNPFLHFFKICVPIVSWNMISFLSSSHSLYDLSWRNTGAHIGWLLCKIRLPTVILSVLKRYCQVKLRGQIWDWRSYFQIQLLQILLEENKNTLEKVTKNHIDTTTCFC